MSNRYEYIDTVARARELGLAGPRDRSAHLHILDVKPLIGSSSVTSVIGSGNALMQWYSDMAAVAALAKPQQDIREAYENANAISDKTERSKAKAELDKQYPDYAEARKAATANRDSAAKKGTLRHGVLEDYIRKCVAENEGKPLATKDEGIQMFIDWAEKEVAKFHFTEANCYHEGLWVGGIADLGLTLKNGKRLIGDHKSSREAYPEQFLKTALYDVLLSHSGILDRYGEKLGTWEPADGIVIFPFRSEPFTPEYRYDMAKWRKGAEDAVSLYKLIELQ